MDRYVSGQVYNITQPHTQPFELQCVLFAILKLEKT